MTKRRPRWIYIVNWDDYQHGHKRGYPWFKVYHELLHNDRFLRLTAADRGILICLFMCASESGDGRVSADSTLLARRLNVRRVSLEPLIHAGFIELRASKALSKRSPTASTESDEQTDREVPKEDQSPPSLRAVGADHEIKDEKISDPVRESIHRLMEDLPDKDNGTLGRLVKLAKNGASQAFFEDARAALKEVRADSPSRYACQVIENRLKLVPK